MYGACSTGIFYNNIKIGTNISSTDGNLHALLVAVDFSVLASLWHLIKRRQHSAGDLLAILFVQDEFAARRLVAFSTPCSSHVQTTDARRSTAGNTIAADQTILLPPHLDAGAHATVVRIIAVVVSVRIEIVERSAIRSTLVQSATTIGVVTTAITIQRLWKPSPVA